MAISEYTKKVVTFKPTPEQEKALKEMDNASKFIREAIQEKMERDIKKWQSKNRKENK